MLLRIAHLWNWWGTGGWLGFIFVISSLPVSSFTQIKEKYSNSLITLIFSDPVGHSGMFAILGFLLGYSLGRTFAEWGIVKVILGIFSLGLVLGLATELYQMLLISGRSFEWADLGWDAVGLAVACGIFVVVKRYA